MFFLEYINPIIFFVALGLGIFLVYIVNPKPKIVYKYPTPENAAKITYVDDEGVCYKYNHEEVSSPQQIENHETHQTHQNREINFDNSEIKSN